MNLSQFRVGGLHAMNTEKIKKIAVIGAGTMGH